MTRMREAVLALTLATVAMPALAEAPSTADYLARAGAGDLFERRASVEVLRTTHSPALRRFARLVIADHGRSTMMVQDAATRAGLHPAPPELSSRQLRMLADLKEVKGARRDQVYVEQQKAVHADALKLQQDYALSGDLPPLQAVAARIVPVVQDHMRMLDAMRF